MQTRSTSGIVKPKQFPTLLPEPTTIKQVLSSPILRQVMQDKYDALMANNTWVLTSLPPGRTYIGCKWIFRVKINVDCTVKK